MDIRQDLGELPDLPGEIMRLVPQIPPGRVATYGDLADALGDRVASRWVGHFLLNHPHSNECGCHRVVRASGELGRFVTGDVQDKANRLRAEGLLIHAGKVELTLARFAESRGASPLRRLRTLQRRLSERISLQDRLPQHRLAGVDVSYDGDQGVAAYVEVDPVSEELRWSTTLRQVIEFPYISSYLAFRELPLLMQLLERVSRDRRLADVLVVDGSGIAHPRRTGIATLLGIAANIPTIGVTKKSLQGRVDTSEMQFGEVRPITDGGLRIGYATLPWPKTSKPIYISPGHMISVNNALTVIEPCLGQRKLPTPIYWADRISRARTQAINSL